MSTFVLSATNFRGLGIGLAAVFALALVACGSDTSAADDPTSTVGATATSSNGTAEPTSETGSGLVFEVGDGSLATFTVTEKLSSLPAPIDAVLETDAITGSVDLDGDNFTISIDLHELESDQSRRDEYVERTLFPQQPIATITFPGVSSLPDGFLDGEEVMTTATGTVNVNGADSEVQFEIEARLDGDVLFILGRADFVWEDFGMTAPKSAFFDVEDDVHVEVLLATSKVS